MYFILNLIIFWLLYQKLFEYNFRGSTICARGRTWYDLLLRTKVLLHLKKTLRLRDFSFYLSSTFYELILIKIYMNGNIMKTQIFHLNKYDLKGHNSTSHFSVNPTLPLLDGPLMLPSTNCVDLSLSHCPSRSL